MTCQRHWSFLYSLASEFIPAFFPVILTCCLVACVGPGRASFAPRDWVDVQFIYPDAKARSVCVAGSFNGWSRDSSCMKKYDGTWSLEMTLAPGRYAYLFVIDGHLWRPDPGAFLNESNGFGETNSILIVE